MPQDQLNRNHYKHFLTIPTRWMDNDIYGHVNNVVYYSYIDTVVNEYLIRQGGLDIHNDPIIGVAVETNCRFMRAFCFPEVIDAGLCVSHLGNSSAHYAIGLFSRDHDQPSAAGRFVHVFVERSANRPAPIPEQIRLALEKIRLE